MQFENVDAVVFDLGFEPLPAIDTLAVVSSRSLVVWFLRSRWLQIQDALSLKDELSESWVRLDHVGSMLKQDPAKLADTWSVSGCGGRCATDASLH